MKSSNKNAQAVGSLMLAKIVTNLYDDLLELVTEEVIERVATTLTGQFKASATLVEALV